MLDLKQQGLCMDKFGKNTYIIAAVAFVLLILGVYFLFVFQKGAKERKPGEEAGEVKSIDQIDVDKRPYVTLTPTSDGAEIIFSMENMGEFDQIEYELTYLADNPQIAGEKIQRGSTGVDVNTKEPKYKKNILLGTASRGVRSPDKGVQDGELVLHLFKGDTEYQSKTPWDMIVAGSTSGKIVDRLGNFSIDLPAFGEDHYFILANTVGIPAENRKVNVSSVRLPVWGAFAVIPEFSQKAAVSVKIDGEGEFSLYSYSHSDSAWKKLEAEFNSGEKTLSASVDSLATFVVVSTK